METSSSQPRSTTWEILKNSRNLAATKTLAKCLSSEHAEIRHACLQAIAVRQDAAAKHAVILHWEKYDEKDITFLRGRAERLATRCSEMLASGTLPEKRVALRAVADLDLSESLDVLLEIVVNPRHALSSQATNCLIDMCRRWGQRARAGRDSLSKRAVMLEKLYSQIVLFHEHKNARIVDAWLNLAHWDDSLQRAVITDPRLDAYRIVMKCFQESKDRAVLQLLGGYLGRSTTPKRIIDIITQRHDPELAIEVVDLCGDRSLQPILKHLKQLPPLPCFKNLTDDHLRLNFPAEKRLWLMVAVSSDNLAQILGGAIKLSKVGTAEARAAAADTLKHCRVTDLDTLVPALQSASVDANAAGSEGALILEVANWLQSPSVVLKKAALNFFQHFTVENLLEQVRHWPAQMCTAMASVVKVAEPDLVEPLAMQLQSPAPKRRLAALQATQMLGCADQVTDLLVPLLKDPKLEVRVRTIDLLSALGFEPLEQMIPQLLADASTDIQDAANRAKRRIEKVRSKAKS